MKKQVVLIILDGWGYRTDTLHNAVAAARTPVFDNIWKTHPHTLLEASGLAVGLPAGQMGNSEVGHTTIGAGKALDQDLVRIQKSIDDGSFLDNPTFTSLFDHVKRNDSTLHIMGLLSDGGVHSHMDHLFAFLRAAKKHGVSKVSLHVFTDGRDAPPQNAAGYLKQLEDVLSEVGIGEIVSVSGRVYAMDRDKNWDRIERALAAMFEAKGETTDLSPSEYVAHVYKTAEGNAALDEHLIPTFFKAKNGDLSGGALAKSDGIFFFNFRADRARQISQKIIERTHGKDIQKNIKFTTLTEYDAAYAADHGVTIAFPKLQIETTLAKEISKVGMTQAHIAETEKFPHATYFLNGGVEKPYDGESHILLNSNKVATHDLAPKMQAAGIADKAIEEINKGTDFIFINIANPNMVGHTANVPAIIEALEETDTQLGRVLEALHAKGGVAFVTADHGNAEVNVEISTGEKHTSHTTNPVPAILTNQPEKIHEGTLADIAPTILQLMEIEKPKGMTGKSLL